MESLPAELVGVPAPLVAVLAADKDAAYTSALLAGLEAANRGACRAAPRGREGAP